MKNIIRTLLAASLALTAIGCDQDQIATKFDPSAEAANTAFFVQNAISQEFDATATGDQTIEVAIYRQNAQGDFTVELTPTIPEDAAEIFDIPKTAEFKNGQYSVMIPVTVHNVENLAKGATYSVKIAVASGGSLEDSNLAIKSKYAETTVSTALALQWEPLYILSDPTKLLSTNLTEADYVKGADGKPIAQTATYVYNGPWQGEDDSVVVERAAGTTVFRMTNWGDGNYNVIFTINPDQKITIEGKEYNVVTVSPQQVTEDATYGKIYVSDLPSCKISKFQGATYEDFPCYWDGERGFHFEFVYFNSQYLFNDPNAHIAETLTLHDGSASME